MRYIRLLKAVYCYCFHKWTRYPIGYRVCLTCGRSIPCQL